MQPILKTTLGMMILLLLGSCGLKGINVPEDKKDYVGYWVSEEMALRISQGGRVEYKRVSGGSSKEINAPIQKFEGDNFIVGAFGINTTFVVSQTPHQDSSGTWYMTVDGVELRKMP